MASTSQTLTHITVVHSMPLFSAPSLDSTLLAWAWPNTKFNVESIQNGFAQVKLANGETAFLAQAACEPNALGFDAKPQTTFLAQPVLLYAKPLPGGQFSADGKYRADLLIRTDEELVVLGKDALFVLIQNARGWLGYVPRMLCRDKALRSGMGAWDTSMIGIGGAWTIAQIGSLRTMMRFVLPLNERMLHLTVSVVLLVLAFVLALLSPRPAVARSFVVGMGLVIVLSQCSMFV